MVCFDSDGLFADWQSYILTHHLPEYEHIDALNAVPAEERSALFQEIYRNDPELFYHLTPILEAKRLIDTVVELGIPWMILTGGTMDHPDYDQLRRSKERFFMRHFGIPRHRIVVTQDSYDKQRYAVRGSLLIDDFGRNCREWAAAGGMAVLCKSNAPDIDAIIKIIKSCHEQAFDISPDIVSV